jgi:hypothetical protein
MTYLQDADGSQRSVSDCKLVSSSILPGYASMAMVKLMERPRYEALVEQGSTIVRFLAHLMRRGPGVAAKT